MTVSPGRRGRSRTTTSEHVVQLFDSRESMVQSVGRYLQDGLAAGDRLFVLARSQNIESLSASLAARGQDMRAALASGRFQVFDAAGTLAQIMSGGEVDSLLFDRAIGHRVRVLTAAGPLRVYGELVDLLAEQDEYDEALTLERLWHGLTEQFQFKLLCGYSSAHFTSGVGAAMLSRICGLHTSATVDTDDMLAEWLLTAVNR